MTNHSLRGLGLRIRDCADNQEAIRAAEEALDHPDMSEGREALQTIFNQIRAAKGVLTIETRERMFAVIQSALTEEAAA